MPFLPFLPFLPFRRFLLIALLLWVGLLPHLAHAVSATSGDLSGTIKDSNGRAVPNARVQILGGPMLGTARTNSSGKYTLADLVPGTYDLITSKPGYVPQHQGTVVIVAGQTTTLNVQLEWADPDSGGVEVYVQDKNGTLLADATVDLTLNGGVLSEVGTDSTGSVTFPGIVPSVYRVAVRRPGYADVLSNNFSVRAGALTTVTVKMKLKSGEFGRIGGIVRNVDGGAVGRATIQIIAGLSRGTVKTDGTGHYQFNNLIPGTGYAIQISAPGYAAQTLGNLIVQLQQLTVQDVALVSNAPTQGSITGIVRDRNGNPLPTASVSITAGAGLGRQVLTGADGRYLFSNLAPGADYAILAEQAGFVPAGANAVSVVAGRTTVIDLVLGTRLAPPGAIAGVVTDPGGGPLSGVVVRLLQGPSAGVATTTDGSGSYRLDQLTPDQGYLVSFSKDGYNAAGFSAVTVENGLTTTLNVELTPVLTSAGTISGTVRDAARHGIAGATVTVYTGPTSPVTATTASDGTYSFPNLRAGTGYGVRVQKADWITQQKTGITVTNAHTTKVDFTLDQSPNVGNISGKVTDLLNHAVSGARVTVLSGPSTPDDVFTDSSGSFAFTGLLPGSYTLQVSSNQFATAQKPGVIVFAGGTTNVSVVLTGP